MQPMPYPAPVWTATWDSEAGREPAGLLFEKETAKSFLKGQVSPEVRSGRGVGSGAGAPRGRARGLRRGARGGGGCREGVWLGGNRSR